MHPRPIALLALLALSATSAVAQQTVPEIRFEANTDLLKLPANVYLGEVAGVAVNSMHHIFVYSRTGQRSSVHGATAAQLFEFGPDGAYVREIGKDLYGFAFAHTVRVDKSDNLWVTDEGTNMIIKFSPAGRVMMVLGRKEEAVEPAPPPAPRARPARRRQRRGPGGARSTGRPTSRGTSRATSSSPTATTTPAS